MKRIIGVFIGILMLSGCTPADSPEDIENDKSVQAVFFGMAATESPQTLGDELINSPATEYNGTFSPDGTEFFYTAEISGVGVICNTSMNADGSWQAPTIASFSGEHSEYDPMFSLDGNRVYFSSERPPSNGQPDDRTYLWYSEKTGDVWGEPVMVQLTGHGDYYSSFTETGKIYFNVWNEGDVYSATPNDTGYTCEVLKGGPNLLNAAGDPFVAKDESYLIFRGYGDDNIGQGDLYISFPGDTAWSEPILLPEPINSTSHEMCPVVTPDGETFIFSSGRMNEEYSFKASIGLDSMLEKFNSPDNGQLNLYYMSSSFIDELRNQ
jgi:Tol biopolymer transport system component